MFATFSVEEDAGDASEPWHQKVVVEVLSAIANERGEASFIGRQTHVRIRNLLSSQVHTVCGMGDLDQISGEINFAPATPLVLDGRLISDIDDLTTLGFDERQMQLLRSHVATGFEIESALSDASTRPPAILGHIIPTERHDMAIGLYDALRLPTQPHAFALFDAVGNADGVPGNPVRHAMTGPMDGASGHHPIVKAYREGISEIVVVRGSGWEFGGEIPTDIQNDLRRLIDDDNISDVGFLHPYTFAVRRQRRQLDLWEIARIPAVALMSKRSFLPLGCDFQVKTGFDGQITAHVRNIHPGEAHNAIENSSAMASLARQQLLPTDTWVVPEFAWRYLPEDVSTTAIIRGGFRHALSNDGIGIPEHLRIVAGSTLWSRNLINPGQTLFEGLVAVGFDPAALHRSIVERLIRMFCNFVRSGVVPESHSQNLMYAFDLERRELAGLVLRDLADSHFAPSVLRNAGIDYQGWNRPDLSDLVLSRLPDDQAKVRIKVAQQFSYVLLHLQVEPISRLVADLYGYRLDDLLSVARQSFWQWADEHPAFPLNDWFDVGGHYVNERASVLLGVPGAGYVRKNSHSLTMAQGRNLPSNEGIVR